MLVTGTVVTVLIAMLIEGPQIVMSSTVAGFLYFALAGVIHFVGGWGFMNASASRIGPTRVSAMTSLTPLFAASLAFITLNEQLNRYLITGILLITFGIYLTATSSE